MTEQKQENVDKGQDAPDAPQEEKAVATTEKAPVHSLFPRFPTKEEWNTMETIARTMIQAGAIPKGIDTAPKMMVILQAGREAGLSPIESLNSLYLVNGKVAMYGEAVPLQIMRAGHSIKWGECNDKTATVTIKRGDNGNEMTQTFTMREAEERGYTSNPVYKKYPENMLKWRVLSMTAKFICPDALRGIGIKEEMEAEIVQKDSKFHDEKEAENIEDDVREGTYSVKRPSLDEALESDDEVDASEVDVDAENEKLHEKRKADAEGRLCAECGFIAKSKGGLTQHINSMHSDDEPAKDEPEE